MASFQLRIKFLPKSITTSMFSYQRKVFVRSTKLFEILIYPMSFYAFWAFVFLCHRM